MQNTVQSFLLPHTTTRDIKHSVTQHVKKTNYDYQKGWKAQMQECLEGTYSHTPPKYVPMIKNIKQPERASHLKKRQ